VRGPSARTAVHAASQLVHPGHCTCCSLSSDLTAVPCTCSSATSPALWMEFAVLSMVFAAILLLGFALIDALTFSCSPLGTLLIGHPIS
jgi:hypothetical protein